LEYRNCNGRKQEDDEDKINLALAIDEACGSRSGIKKIWGYFAGIAGRSSMTDGHLCRRSQWIKPTGRGIDELLKTLARHDHTHALYNIIIPTN
jgi:hypothetical protein